MYSDMRYKYISARRLVGYGALICLYTVHIDIQYDMVVSAVSDSGHQGEYLVRL